VRIVTTICLQMAAASGSVNAYNKHSGNETFSTMTALGGNEISSTEPVNDDCQFMPGIQMESARSFSRRCDEDIHVTPIIVDFRSILLSKTRVEIVKGVSMMLLKF